MAARYAAGRKSVNIHRALLTYFWQALCNPYVIGGTVLNAVFYFLFLAALSSTDVTVALPITAIEYGIAALLGCRSP